VESAPGRVFFRNAGLSRHQGVEASAALSPRAGTRLRAAYTYTDARFQDYRVGDADVAGNRVPGIAPSRLNLSLWTGRRAGAFGGLELRTASATPVSDTDGPGVLRSPGYSLIDLRGGWAGVRAGFLRLTPWAALTNALDRRYNASVVVNAFGGRYYEPGPGRALYLGVDLDTGDI
jgi:iron complex outermembrane recepter protein